MSNVNNRIRFDAIASLVKRNIKLRYKNTLLGFAWSFITPLMYLLIFHFVFSQAFQGMRSYSLYVLSGLVLWQFFNNIGNECIQSFLSNSGIIKTINLPILAFPLASLVTELVNLCLVLVPFFGLMAFFGLSVGTHTLLFVPIILLMAIFSLGIGLLLGSLNVFLRDISILWNTINPALFYLTPIAYTIDFVPENYHTFFKLNPLYHYFAAVREVLYFNTVPSAFDFLMLTVLSLGTFAIGFFTFKKLESGLISNL